jgi:hypothetical protein
VSLPRLRRVCGLLVLLVAGCGGHSAPHAAKRSVELVPFDDAQPAALSAQPASPAPACRARQLRVEGEGLQLVPGTQNGGTGGIVFVNGGSRPCRLTGRPTVRFVGGTAPPKQEQRELGADPPAFPSVAPASESLLALAPGERAVLGVEWENWCPRASVAAKQKGVQPPKALRVTLPGHSSSLDVRYSAVVSCVHQKQPSVISVRPFAPHPLQAKTAFTNVPMTVKLHPLDGGGGTLRGRRGQDLRFSVELRNASSTETVRFDQCPLVAEKFAPIGSTEAHQLNCRAATAIRPGAVQWFEMRVRVPKEAPLGANGLFWRLDPAGEFGPQAVARVVVER